MKSTCFVMQIFDGEAYDRRYEETFAPAIISGGAAPVRADRILGSKPIIEKIENALRDATVAFAEISENNPNVFTELGYALSMRIPLVMVCDKSKRASLPFDIGHRPVIFYRTESAGDFVKLKEEIESAVKAALIEAVAQVSQEPSYVDQNRDQKFVSDGLKDRLMLEVLEAETGDSMGISAYSLTRSMSNQGYSNGLTSLAVLSLVKESIIYKNEGADRDGDAVIYYSLSEKGRDMLLERYADIKREEEEAARQATANRNAAWGRAGQLSASDDDDVPF